MHAVGHCRMTCPPGKFTFGLFPAYRLSKILGDQSSFHYAVLAILQIMDQILLWIVLIQIQGTHSALYQVSELSSFCAHCLFCEESYGCRSPRTPSCNRALLSTKSKLKAVKCQKSKQSTCGWVITSQAQLLKDSGQGKGGEQPGNCLDTTAKC